jgi:quercetin dioxygenase-like cupin family protein
MDPIAVELDMLADYLLDEASTNPQRRASQRIGLDHQHLRITAIGFATGAELPEHQNPGEALLQVVRGRIRLSEGPRVNPARALDVGAGTIARVPDGVHRLEALEPSMVVLISISVPRAAAVVNAG